MGLQFVSVAAEVEVVAELAVPAEVREVERFLFARLGWVKAPVTDPAEVQHDR
jgi:hypothetical protein